MDPNLAKLAKYKQIMGIAVAGLILAVIFVPFQKASAYTVDFTLPNTSASAVPTSALGSAFKTTITISAGELIRIDSIEMILDSGTSSVQHTIFDSSGKKTSGSATLVRGNLDISIPSSATQQYGYGYGYGLVSSGATFSAPYTYSFSYSNALISGNTGGYTNAVSGANNIYGVIGPATVTIEGKLNTAYMPTGSHVLEMLIRTGSGGNNVDKIVAPPLVFTTTGNTSLATKLLSAGSNVEYKPSNSNTVKIQKLLFSLLSEEVNVSLEKPSISSLKSAFSDIFTFSAEDKKPQFTSSGKTYLSITDVVDISLDKTLSSGTLDITFSYDPDNLPGGISEGDLKILHYTGTKWEDISVSVDTAANTITGRINFATGSLSPVTVGAQVTTTSTTTTGTSTGGGGGGGSTVDLTATYPDSYFASFPLKKVQVSNAGVVNAQGNTVNTITAGQQVSITSTFRNYQERSQAFAYIVQVVNSNGFTVDLGWQTGTLASGQSTQLSRSWTAEDSGTYTIKAFIWNGVSAAPVPLSEVTTRTLSVS